MTTTSQLTDTDPDLVGYFDDFAFDQVPGHDDLEQRTRLLCRLAALIACQAHGQYRIALDEALSAADITPVEIKEIVYQAVPYLGMGKPASVDGSPTARPQWHALAALPTLNGQPDHPRGGALPARTPGVARDGARPRMQAQAYDFLLVTNEILTERGVDLPLPSQSTTTPQDRREKGAAVQKRIVGAQRFDAMQTSGPDDLQHIQEFLSANCFGDHYTRTGLELRTRELITFVLLIAHGGCDQQVRGHVQGNVNVGNDRTMLINVVTQLLPYIGYPRALNAIAAINEVTPPE